MICESKYLELAHIRVLRESHTVFPIHLTGWKYTASFSVYQMFLYEFTCLITKQYAYIVQHSSNVLTHLIGYRCGLTS